MSSIFTFLQEVNEGLYALALQAEADVWSNPRATLTQGRLFSEELASIVSKMEKVEPVYYIKSNERIQLLARKDIISEELKDSFEWLRRSGNMAAHDPKPVPPDLALTAHRHLFTLALWYVESYGSLDIELPTYAMPIMPASQEPEQTESKLDVSEQLEQLLSAQLEAKLLPTLTEQFKSLEAKIMEVAGSITVIQPSSGLVDAPAVSNSDSESLTSRVKSELEAQIEPELERVKLPTIETQTELKSVQEVKQSVKESSISATTAGDVEVGDYLAEQGMTIVDKRQNSGALWIVGGWELKDALFALRPYGIHFKFAKNGSQSTKRKPAWFMMGKDPSQLRYLPGVADQQVAVSVALPMESGSVHSSEEVEPVESGDMFAGVNTFIQGNMSSVQSQLSSSQSEAANSESTEALTELRKSFMNKELLFPASMIGLSLNELDINGCGSLVQYLQQDCGVKTIQDLPEDLFAVTEKISGVGPKTIERFVKQLEEAIVEEKRLIGSGKRKEQAVIAYRELKRKLGRRPSYIELHQQANIDSQEYRQLFESYYTFLLQAKELDKEEAAVAKRYTNWLHEVEHTIMRKSYKMVLLLAMLDRGAHTWTNAITALEAAPFFYRYYMEDESRKQIDFSDNETQKLWDAPLERTAQFIARMPMTQWSKAASKLIQHKDGMFRCKLPIREGDEQLLYEWTRHICEYRLLSYFERKGTSD